MFILCVLKQVGSEPLDAIGKLNKCDFPQCHPFGRMCCILDPQYPQNALQYLQALPREKANQEHLFGPFFSQQKVGWAQK